MKWILKVLECWSCHHIWQLDSVHNRCTCIKCGKRRFISSSEVVELDYTISEFKYDRQRYSN